MGKKNQTEVAPAEATHKYLMEVEELTYQAIENVALRRRQAGNRGYSVRQLMTELLTRGVKRTPEVKKELDRLMVDEGLMGPQDPKKIP